MVNATLPPLVNCPARGGVPRKAAKFSPAARAGLFTLGLVLVTLLVMARWLTPNPAGFGTHEQLGLGPCFTLQLWEIRCPTCGMTTAWAHALRGEFADATRANSAGAILCLLAAMTAPWAIVSGLRGKWCGWKPTESVVLGVAGTLVVLVLLDFLVRNRLFGYI